MSRPIKTGLDYFPLDVFMDEKVELIEAKHGIVGFGLIIKLYQSIYKNGYYFNVNEERVLVLKKRVNVDINVINDVINDACRWDIFSEKLYKKYTILTSTGIQKRFIEATKRRSEISFIKEYLLVKDLNKLYGEKVIVNINSINDDISTQRKGKERKKKNKYIPHQNAGYEKDFYLTKKKKKLSGKRLESFNQFWDCFNYKFDKASAADAWLEIESLTDSLVNIICESAIKESESRQSKIDKNQTPIYAQGWINSRRWEDESPKQNIIKHKQKDFNDLFKNDEQIYKG